jgi:hypothetical protein
VPLRCTIVGLDAFGKHNGHMSLPYCRPGTAAFVGALWWVSCLLAIPGSLAILVTPAVQLMLVIPEIPVILVTPAIPANPVILVSPPCRLAQDCEGSRRAIFDEVVQFVVLVGAVHCSNGLGEAGI